MNTMPFPDGSQEVPRSLLVALPEFRLNPLNGRTAPNTGISRSIAPSQKRSARPGLGTFAPFPGQEYVVMDGKPLAPAVANSSAESRQREFAGVSAGREPGREAVACHAEYAKRRPECGDRG